METTHVLKVQLYLSELVNFMPSQKGSMAYHREERP
jgi:hypothetical protein